MNTVILTGNLVRDPELKTTQNGTAVCSFTVAVNRRFSDASGNKVTDFLPCTAWKQSAEYVAKYGAKGRKICVRGTLQTREYDTADGSKRKVTEIIADETEFTDRRNEENGKKDVKVPFDELVEAEDDGLPF